MLNNSRSLRTTRWDVEIFKRLRRAPQKLSFHCAVTPRTAETRVVRQISCFECGLWNRKLDTMSHNQDISRVLARISTNTRTHSPRLHTVYPHPCQVEMETNFCEVWWCFTIMEKAPTGTFTFETPLRHFWIYANHWLWNLREHSFPALVSGVSQGVRVSRCPHDSRFTWHLEHLIHYTCTLQCVELWGYMRSLQI